MADRKAFLLRLSPETLIALREWASQEMRSVNGQIEYALRDALRRQGLLKQPQPHKPRRRRPDG